MSQWETYRKLAPGPEYFRESGDGLLFASLQAIGTGKPLDIREYMGTNGQVFRNLAMTKGVHILGPRESTISRDMFMGLFCYCLHFGRLDILRTIASYGWRHWWKMGVENRKLDISFLGRKFQILSDNRVWFTPGLVILLYALLAHLRGKSGLAKLLTNIWQPLGTTPGYPSHLTMLHIYLNYRIRGNLVSWEQKALRDIIQHSPRNPLALALAGWKDEAFQELQNTWPKDRLPNKRDWTEEWRTQRADNDVGIVWGNPNDITPHSGGDLLFVYHVLTL